MEQPWAGQPGCRDALHPPSATLRNVPSYSPPLLGESTTGATSKTTWTSQRSRLSRTLAVVPLNPAQGAAPPRRLLLLPPLLPPLRLPATATNKLRTPPGLPLFLH